jgi:arsenate reductase
LGQAPHIDWRNSDVAEVEKKFAIRQAFTAMETRIKLFLSLPIASIDKMRLQERMNAIGKTPLEVVPK